METLDPASPRWAGLQHAYGSADDVAQILDGMANGSISLNHPDVEEALWSRLCHQEKVYPASYAAVPHLIKLSCENAETVSWSFLYLINNIEVGRHIQNAPEIPRDLLSPYVAALKMIPDLIARLMKRSDVTGYNWSVVLAQSAAIMSGNVRLARVLNSFEPDDAFFDDIEGYLSKR